MSSPKDDAANQPDASDEVDSDSMSVVEKARGIAASVVQSVLRGELSLPSACSLMMISACLVVGCLTDKDKQSLAYDVASKQFLDAMTVAKSDLGLAPKREQGAPKRPKAVLRSLESVDPGFDFVDEQVGEFVKAISLFCDEKVQKLEVSETIKLTIIVNALCRAAGLMIGANAPLLFDDQVSDVVVANELSSVIREGITLGGKMQMESRANAPTSSRTQ